MKSLLLIFIFVSLLVLASLPTPTNSQTVADKSCRQHPQLVGSCFMVRGRLSVFNGAPALRIWKIGTKRVLGVSDQRFLKAGYKNIPDNIREMVNQDTDVYGDFQVCPFTKPRVGQMQLVCIESGKKLAGKASTNSGQ